jgi:hypothetical protein
MYTGNIGADTTLHDAFLREPEDRKTLKEVTGKRFRENLKTSADLVLATASLYLGGAALASLTRGGLFALSRHSLSILKYMSSIGALTIAQIARFTGSNEADVRTYLRDRAVDLSTNAIQSLQKRVALKRLGKVDEVMAQNPEHRVASKQPARKVEIVSPNKSRPAAELAIVPISPARIAKESVKMVEAKSPAKMAKESVKMVEAKSLPLTRAVGRAFAQEVRKRAVNLATEYTKGTHLEAESKQGIEDLRNASYNEVTDPQWWLDAGMRFGPYLLRELLANANPPPMNHEPSPREIRDYKHAIVHIEDEEKRQDRLRYVLQHDDIDAARLLVRREYRDSIQHVRNGDLLR